jgi:hypothetical protein
MKNVAVLMLFAVWGIVWWGISRKMAGKSGWLRHPVGIVAGFFVGGIVGAILMPSDKEANMAQAPSPASAVLAASAQATAKTDGPAVSSSTSQAKVEEVKDAKEEEPDLGMTPKEFAIAFNAKMKSVNLPYRLKLSAKKASGDELDAYASQLSDRIGFMGMASKASGKMHEVMIMAGGDGTANSGLEAILVGSALFSAALPDVDQKTIGPLALKLLKDAHASKDKEASTVLNEVKLSYTASEVIGNVFTASPVR